MAGNTRRTHELLDRARVEAADLVVLPELTLTGYSLGRVNEDVSRSVDEPEIAGSPRRTDGIACVVGFAEAGRVHTYNSAAYLERGAVRHVHRKLYLADLRHLGGAQALHARETPCALSTRTVAGRVAILICIDAWQPALAVLAVQDGARVLIVPANSTRPASRPSRTNGATSTASTPECSSATWSS